MRQWRERTVTARPSLLSFLHHLLIPNKEKGHVRFFFFRRCSFTIYHSLSIIHDLRSCEEATKEALSVLMLCAPVFIFTSGSSALLGRPRCGYRSDCHYLPYSIHFSEFMSICSRENGQNTKILEVCHSRMIRKWPRTVTRRAKH